MKIKTALHNEGIEKVILSCNRLTSKEKKNIIEMFSVVEELAEADYLQARWSEADKKLIRLQNRAQKLAQ